MQKSTLLDQKPLHQTSLQVNTQRFQEKYQEKITSEIETAEALASFSQGCHLEFARRTSDEKARTSLCLEGGEGVFETAYVSSASIDVLGSILSF